MRRSLLRHAHPVLFLDQLLVFTVIAGCLLVLNVAQAWLREMIKLKSREWLTRDLFGESLKPGRPIRLARAGEVGRRPSFSRAFG